MQNDIFASLYTQLVEVEAGINKVDDELRLNAKTLRFANHARYLRGETQKLRNGLRELERMLQPARDEGELEL